MMNEELQVEIGIYRGSNRVLFVRQRVYAPIYYNLADERAIIELNPTGRLPYKLVGFDFVPSIEDLEVSP